MIVIVAVRRLQLFGLRVAEHERLNDLAQGVLLQGSMSRQEAGQAREDKRLHGQKLISLALPHAFLIADRPGQSILEELVQGGIHGLRAQCSAFHQQGLCMGAKVLVERALQPGFLVQISTHLCRPRRCAWHQIHLVATT
jgi:hypothetical protein